MPEHREDYTKSEKLAYLQGKKDVLQHLLTALCSAELTKNARKYVRQLIKYAENDIIRLKD